ncbi:MAG: MFS transporter [Methanobacteriaceae archaeon]|nr:MFS transporter [Methanobacteriaceae archaeon]
MKFGSSKNYALLVAVLASFVTPFMGSSINVALPSIANDFLITAIMLSWIPTSYLLSLAIFLIPFGRIADIYGRKMIFTYGIIIFTVASLIAAFSTSAVMLIILRIFQGMGSAMIFGNVAAIISSIFPSTERGKALGISITGVFMGLFLGPVLGGFLTQYLGWRSIFFFNVPLGILATYSVVKLQGEWAEAKGEKFDILGSIILGISLITLMYGLSLLPEILGFIMIVGGIIGIIIFYFVEKNIESPVLNVSLFKNMSFTFNNLAALINYNSGVPIVFLLSLYLQYVKGLDPQDSGLILSVQPIMMALFSPFAGRLSDRFRAEYVAASGMGITAIGLAGFAFLNPETHLWLIGLGLGIIGLGFALFSSPNTNALMNSVDEKYYGVASATLSSMRVLGQMTGMGITMLALAIFIGNADIVPANYSSFLSSSTVSFILFAFLSFIGLSLSILSIRKI